MLEKPIKAVLIFILFIVVGCVPPAEEGGDKILAKVYDKPLYLSELDGMIPKTATPNDSSLIVNSFVERWVRENLMLYEAERNVSQDLNIDKLVRDYRASLILHNYEKQIAETQLDSTILDDEIMAYYDENKSHFQLETSIMRCKFMKIKKDAPKQKKAEELWDSDDEDDLKKLKKYCGVHAIVYQLEDSIWMNKDEMKADFPKEIISSMRRGKEFKEVHDGFKYYVKVMEVQSKNSDPPIAYVRDQATKFILHNRKIDIVEKTREELYQKATNKGHVKILDYN